MNTEPSPQPQPERPAGQGGQPEPLTVNPERDQVRAQIEVAVAAAEAEFEAPEAGAGHEAGLDLDPTLLSKLRSVAEQALQAGDVERFLAAARRLSDSPAGTETLRGFQEQNFHRTNEATVDAKQADPALVSALEQQYGGLYTLHDLNAAMLDKVDPHRRPDLFQPDTEAFGELEPAGFQQLDQYGLVYYARWVDRQTGEEAARYRSLAHGNVTATLDDPRGRTRFNAEHYLGLGMLMFNTVLEEETAEDGHLRPVQRLTDATGNHVVDASQAGTALKPKYADVAAEHPDVIRQILMQFERQFKTGA